MIKNNSLVPVTINSQIINSAPDSKIDNINNLQVQVQYQDSKIMLNGHLTDKNDNLKPIELQKLQNQSVNMDVLQGVENQQKHEIDDMEWNALVQTVYPNQQVSVVHQLFQKEGWYSQYKIEKRLFFNFLHHMKRKYNKNNNPFHNFQHGIQVMQCCYALTRLDTISQYLNQDLIFTLVFSGLCHDVDHRGKSNSFEVASQSKLAIRYNDRSPLENHHSAMTFKLILKHGILSNMDPQKFKKFRKQVIENILATDNAKHIKLLHEFQKIVEKQNNCIQGRSKKYTCLGLNSPDQDIIIEETQQQSLKSSNLNSLNISQQSNNSQDKSVDFTEKELSVISQTLIHTSDFSGAVKKLPISRQWSQKLNLEFSQQYQQEGQLGLKQTPFLKDLNVDYVLGGNESSFLNMFVLPLWKMIHDFSGQKLSKQIENTEQTIAYWRKLANTSPRKSTIKSQRSNNSQILNSDNTPRNTNLLQVNNNKVLKVDETKEEA